MRAILAAADEDQADQLYNRLHKMGIRIVSASGETVDSLSESNNVLNSFEDDILDVTESIYGNSDTEDDPVHTYLKEIGQVPLLTSDQEVWLSTQFKAASELDRLTRDLNPEIENEYSIHFQAMMANYQELFDSWQQILVSCEDLGVEWPEFALLAAEAQEPRHTWKSETPSYVRQFLNKGNWGQDDIWTELAERTFVAYTALYILPNGRSQMVSEAYAESGALPEPDIFFTRMEEDDVALKIQ
ncbi:MAG: hypothetical protein M5U34_28945 [Chloroflexi bacterium]|nr:hypothetical protein [Chloroflexota bacterium]